MEDTKIIITVLGADKIGLIAKFATILSDMNVNVEDVRQTLMQDYFTMVMMADYSKSPNRFSEIKDAVMKLGEELEMEAWVQRKKIFDKMHII
ncbi:MAG: ACT domain-containing protein [bacterium]